MGIVQIPSKTMVTQRAKFAKFVKTYPSSSGTYYTALDLTGRGVLFAIMASISEYLEENEHLFIKVTIDGKEEIINPDNSSNSFFGTLFYQSGETYPYKFDSKIDYISQLTFFYSLKIEVMQNLGNSAISCNIQYGLE